MNKISDWKIAEVLEGLDYDCINLFRFNKKNESMVAGEKKFTLITSGKISTWEYGDIMELEVHKSYPALLQGRDTIYELVYNACLIRFYMEDEIVEIKMPVGTYQVNKETDETVSEIKVAVRSGKPFVSIKNTSEATIF